MVSFSFESLLILTVSRDEDTTAGNSRVLRRTFLGGRPLGRFWSCGEMASAVLSTGFSEISLPGKVVTIFLGRPLGLLGGGRGGAIKGCGITVCCSSTGGGRGGGRRGGGGRTFGGSVDDSVSKYLAYETFVPGRRVLRVVWGGRGSGGGRKGGAEATPVFLLADSITGFSFCNTSLLPKWLFLPRPRPRPGFLPVVIFTLPAGRPPRPSLPPFAR